MVSTYSQATRRDQNQCSLGSFGLVIKLRDCDIGLERDSSPVEREKKWKEREPDLAPQTIDAERTDMHTNARIKIERCLELNSESDSKKKIIDRS